MRWCAEGCAVLLSAVLVVSSGCGRRDLAGPPELRPGRDECAECGMLIYDERCAGAFLLDGGAGREHLLFDDMGCMLDHELVTTPETKIIDRFVRDYSTSLWVGSSRAICLRSGSDRIRTPMGSGIVAFADRSAAEGALAEFGGELTTYAALLEARGAPIAAPPGAP